MPKYEVVATWRREFPGIEADTYPEALRKVEAEFARRPADELAADLIRGIAFVAVAEAEPTEAPSDREYDTPGGPTIRPRRERPGRRPDEPGGAVAAV